MQESKLTTYVRPLGFLISKERYMFKKLSYPGSVPAALGEGPMWDPKEKKLYWLDIAEYSVHYLAIETNEHKSWKMPEIIGALVLRASGGLIVAVGNSIYSLELENNKLEKIVTLPTTTHTGLRFNDGKCDRLGRFWVGMADRSLENPQGGLFRIDPDGTATQMEYGITISNGLGWSPDDKIFYFTDTLRHCVYQYDFDLALGQISNRRIFIQIKPEDGFPDGLTIDSAGFIWLALWDGGKILRISPDGNIDREIKFPIKRPTSCIFGGENFQTLFVTSCSRDINEDKTLPEPAGALFSLDLSISGLPETSFAG